MLNPKSVNFCIEPLEKHHDRATFSCGNEQLDRYFHFAATQDQKRNIAIPYVIFDRERQKIIGYYTLSTTGINLEQLPQSIVKKLPKYPIVGTVFIGRLAVADDYRGFGWGKLLIMDALYRSLRVSQTTGCFAVVVDAIDDEAVRFYQRFEFQIFPDQPHKLFRTMTNIAQTFDSLQKKSQGT
ncbi:GNAT family N-acetyltransferase [Chlorogloea sp. CCALA 695]|uniref:GNAT family N-acetyltransferase n=1 Tax=Chlorogloea sp. CCALA 695 TaxID=2107693 RepID=UPI000D076DF9|nr:GNAT family N-acetyltransferase [Chlorogloea sp. CCALA 695]PSB32708.1 N-acetyltransferase [Chlorogloea sp. CCALA 695]